MYIYLREADKAVYVIQRRSIGEENYIWCQELSGAFGFAGWQANGTKALQAEEAFFVIGL